MKRTPAVFAWGLLLAIGLGVSGMTKPSTIIGFLDIISGLGGSWNPRLAFVVGAVLLGNFIFRPIRARMSPPSSESLDLPPTAGFDRRLVAGAVAFGVGLGLGGFFPAPAIVGLATGRLPTVVFVVAMLIGVRLAERQE